MLMLFISSLLFSRSLSATCNECWSNYETCSWDTENEAWEECSKVWDEDSGIAPFNRECIEEQAQEAVECYTNAGCFEAGNDKCWWKLWELGCSPYKCEAYTICTDNYVNEKNCDGTLKECKQNCDDSDSYDSSYDDSCDCGDGVYDDCCGGDDSYGDSDQSWQYVYEEVPECIRTECHDELTQCGGSDACVTGIEGVASKCESYGEETSVCLQDTFVDNVGDGAYELCNSDDVCASDLQSLGECVINQDCFTEPEKLKRAVKAIARQQKKSKSSAKRKRKVVRARRSRKRSRRSRRKRVKSVKPRRRRKQSVRGRRSRRKLQESYGDSFGDSDDDDDDDSDDDGPCFCYDADGTEHECPCDDYNYYGDSYYGDGYYGDGYYGDGYYGDDSYDDGTCFCSDGDGIEHECPCDDYNYYGDDSYDDEDGSCGGHQWEYDYNDIPDCIKNYCDESLVSCADEGSCKTAIEGIVYQCSGAEHGVEQCVEDIFDDDEQSAIYDLCEDDGICAELFDDLGQCVVTNGCHQDERKHHHGDGCHQDKAVLKKIKSLAKAVKSIRKQKLKKLRAKSVKRKNVVQRRRRKQQKGRRSRRRLVSLNGRRKRRGRRQRVSKQQRLRNNRKRRAKFEVQRQQFNKQKRRFAAQRRKFNARRARKSRL